MLRKGERPSLLSLSSAERREIPFDFLLFWDRGSQFRSPSPRRPSLTMSAQGRCYLGTEVNKHFLEQVRGINLHDQTRAELCVSCVDRGSNSVFLKESGFLACLSKGPRQSFAGESSNHKYLTFLTLLYYSWTIGVAKYPCNVYKGIKEHGYFFLITQKEIY